VEVRTFDATTRPRVKAVPGNFQSSGGTSRFRGSVTVKDVSDSLVIVEAGPKLTGGTPTSPEIVNVVEPEVVPLAFTNPILIDAGGDGFALRAVGAVMAGTPAGRMTGVTREARAAAVARGEYFPLGTFRLGAGDIAAARARNAP
jgi:hypothetical protein